MPQEFTIRSAPTYRSLEAVLPSAEAMRAQQQELINRRSQALRAIGEEIRSAMAQGFDSVVLTMTPGWRERALEQAGYEVIPAPPETGMAADRFIVYFGQRDASDRAEYFHSLARPDGEPAVAAYRAPSPPSPSVYARSVFIPASPPPATAPPIAPVPKPPFARGQTVPGPEYRTIPVRPERNAGVAFAQDVDGGRYTPRPGQRF